jgi:outer membrane receptor protein involved in Fe transport
MKSCASRVWFVVVGLCLGPLMRAAAAQEASPIVANLSLEELSKLRVTIASVADKPVREQPGIVTVITEQQIADSGARDLMDILALVPGFSFGNDVDAVLGAEFRGLWAYEGKILLLIDGIPVNEGLYGTLQMGRHYSAGLIKQVEIIRGPGSARYGGNAELAVLSVTTKAADQQGGFALVRQQVASGRVGTSVDAGAGYSFVNGWRAAFGAHYEDYIRSDRTYVSLGGDVVDTKSRSTMTPAMITGQIGWRDLDVRMLYDDYSLDNPIGFGDPSLQATPWSETFRSAMGSVKYDVKPNGWLTISPRIITGRQYPWWLQTSPGQGDFQLRYDRQTFEVPAAMAFDDRNHLLVGMALYGEQATALQTSPLFGQPPVHVFFAGSERVSYRDASGYAQYDVDMAWADVTLGGRYEAHSHAGSAFVPRIGITRAWERVHVKLLFDQAFRTPNVETIQQRLRDTSVTYEKSTGSQFEAGYRFNERVSLVGNLYNLRVDKPLAFTVLDNPTFGYVNGSAISTNGGEAELRYQDNSLSGYVGYGYYRADDQLSSALGLYASAQEGQNLALPSHKVSFLGAYRIRKPLTWSASGIHSSARWMFAYPGDESRLSPELNLNTLLEYRGRAVTLGVAVHNLLDEMLVAGQPYNGGGAPLPLPGRDVSLTIGYKF